MRILHVLPRLDVGGMERMVLQLAPDAVARGDEVAVASAGGVWEAQLGPLGVRVSRIPLLSRSPARILRVGASLARVVRSFRPHVVHAHNPTASQAARVATVLARPWRPAPVMTTVHGLAPADYGRAARVLRLTTRRIVACAPAVRDHLAAAGYPADKIDVITNGAGFEPAPDDRVARLYATLGVAPGTAVIGVGRLVEQKAWPIFVGAAGLVADRSFLVAGVGPLRDELESLAEREGAPVTFVGRVDDMAALYGGAACLLSTSDWEGLPLSLLEALSVGTPAIVTAVDGITDVVPADAVQFIPVGSPRAAADAVVALLAGNADALGARARAAAPAWSIEGMLSGYRDLYRRSAPSAAT